MSLPRFLAEIRENCLAYFLRALLDVKDRGTPTLGVDCIDRRAKILVREQRLLDYGRKRIDLSKVEQLVDAGQTEAIGRLLGYCHERDPEQQNGLIASLQAALKNIEQQGLDILLPWKAGHLALPRLYEIAAAANRLRN